MKPPFGTDLPPTIRIRNRERGTTTSGYHLINRGRHNMRRDIHNACADLGSRWLSLSVSCPKLNFSQQSFLLRGVIDMETPQLLDIVSGRAPILAAAAAVCLIAYILPRIIAAIRLSAIPVVGRELGGEEKRRQAYLAGARKLYNDGYKKVRFLNFYVFLTERSY